MFDIIRLYDDVPRNVKTKTFISSIEVMVKNTAESKLEFMD